MIKEIAKKKIKRFSKNTWATISLLGLILILIFLIFLIDQKPRIKYAKYPTRFPTITRKPPTPNPPDPITIKDTASPFQKHLVENCKPVFHKEESGGWYSYEIENKDLPFVTDDAKFPKKVWRCVFTGKENYSGERDGSGYLTYEDWNYLVYDDESVEAGHGGGPAIGRFGTLIKNSGDISIRFQIIGEGPIILDDTTIVGRFTKELTYNSKPIFINVFEEIFPANNQRLINLLYLHSKIEDSRRVVDWDKISSEEFDQLVKNEFFSDMDNLPEPQRRIIQDTEDFLNNITSL